MRWLVLRFQKPVSPPIVVFPLIFFITFAFFMYLFIFPCDLFHFGSLMLSLYSDFRYPFNRSLSSSLGILVRLIDPSELYISLSLSVYLLPFFPFFFFSINLSYLSLYFSFIFFFNSNLHSYLSHFLYVRLVWFITKQSFPLLLKHTAFFIRFNISPLLLWKVSCLFVSRSLNFSNTFIFCLRLTPPHVFKVQWFCLFELFVFFKLLALEIIFHSYSFPLDNE